MSQTTQEHIEQPLVQSSTNDTQRASSLAPLKRWAKAGILLALVAGWGLLLISSNIYQTQLLAATLVIGFAALLGRMNQHSQQQSNQKSSKSIGPCQLEKFKNNYS